VGATSAPRLRHPVVLAHGLLGFSRVAVRLGGADLGVSYFRGIAERLAAAGNRVLVPPVPPTGSIARRAEALRAAIVAEFGEGAGAPRVHVVGHSMGGLDARHAITHLGLADRVVSLTTLGTPHRGSPVADRGTEAARKVSLFDVLRAFGGDGAAFEDLRSDACAAFNAATPDAPGVRYASVAGRKPVGEMAVALRLSGAQVADADGDNDGLVSLRSARWGESFDVVDADHFDLVGWTPPLASPLGRPVDVAAIWDGVLARMASFDAGPGG
jgi:triacylglycerol lipase